MYKGLFKEFEVALGIFEMEIEKMGDTADDMDVSDFESIMCTLKQMEKVHKLHASLLSEHDRFIALSQRLLNLSHDSKAIMKDSYEKVTSILPDEVKQMIEEL